MSGHAVCLVAQKVAIALSDRGFLEYALTDPRAPTFPYRSPTAASARTAAFAVAPYAR